MTEALRYQPLAPAQGEGRTAAVAPVFTGLGIVEAVADALYPAHQHHDYEVIVPDRGRYRCRLNHTLVTLEANQVLIVAPGDHHEDEFRAGDRVVGVWFNLGNMPLFAPGLAAQGHIAALPRHEREPLITRLLAEQVAPDAVSLRLQESLCAELFWRVVRALPAGSLAPGFIQAGEDAVFTQQLSALFHQRYRGNVSLDEMATALHCAPRVLTARCRRSTGQSPAKAFAAFRLGRAQDLLLHTSQSVKEVAAYLGFSDQHHFSRAFKAHFGRSPST